MDFASLYPKYLAWTSGSPFYGDDGLTASKADLLNKLESYIWDCDEMGMSLDELKASEYMGYSGDEMIYLVNYLQEGS